MKKCLHNRFLSFSALLVLMCCITTAHMHAQVATYKFVQSNGTYTPVTGGTTIAAPTDPAGFGVAVMQGINIKTKLPFTFKYNSINYDTCYISEDGSISFGAPLTSLGPPLNTSDGEGMVAIMGCDLNGLFSTAGNISTGSPTITNVSAFNGIAVGKVISAPGFAAGSTIVAFDATAKTVTVSVNATAPATNAIVKWLIGEIKTQVTGVSPNRKFIIDYQNLADVGFVALNSSAFSFQIQLEETTNRINFVYGPYSALSTSTKQPQVGLRGLTYLDFNTRASTTSWTATTAGTNAFANVYRNNTNFPANGLTFTWQIATCYYPTDIGFTSISATGATLNWNPPALGGTPSGYQWEVRTSGVPGSGATGLVASGNATGTSAVVTGLTAATVYSFYLRTDCGSGDYSVWTPATNLKTTCNSAARTTPYKEDFNTFTSTATLPACWSLGGGRLTNATKFSGFPSGFTTWQPTTTPPLSDRMAQLGMGLALQGEWLISPSVDIGTAKDHRVEFDFALLNGFSRDTMLGPDDTLALVISTDNGLTWSKNNVLQMWTAANTPYPSGKVVVPLPTYTGTVKFGFYTYEGVNERSDVFIINNFIVRDTSCPVVNLGKDITGCTNGSRKDTLNAGYFAGTTYAWDDLSTGQTRIINATGTYSVAVTRMGCTERDTIKATYNNFLVSKLGNDTVLCGGTSLLLDPGVAISSTNMVRWVIPGAYASTWNATQSGMYPVELTIAGIPGCTTRDTINVKIIPNLPIIALGNDTTFCSGDSLTLDINNPGLTYLWNDNSTNQTRTVKASGTYSATVFDNDGCKSRDSIVVTMVPSPVVELGIDTGICMGTQLILDASNLGAQYLWDDATTNQLRVINAAGQYSVLITDANNCTAVDTINVTVNPFPKFDSIVATLTGVREYNFSLPGTLGINTYSWNFGDGTANGTAASEVHQYTTDGQYSVIATVVGDCGTYADTIELNVKDVGVENYENAHDGVALYPNPVHGMLNIAYPLQLQQKQFAIYNLTGAKIISATFNTDGMQQLDVSAFAPGIYCLFIIGDDSVWPSYKFVVSGK